MMVKRSFMVLSFLFASSGALAQVCDPSNATGQCGFRDANGNLVRSPEEVYSSYQQQGRTAYNPSTGNPRIIKKADSFGAMASSTKSGKVFTVTHHRSINAANKGAMYKCEQATGEKCIIRHTFRNGCMTATSGMAKNGGYLLFPESAPTLREAEKKAMAACQAAAVDCLLVFESDEPLCSFS